MGPGVRRGAAAASPSLSLHPPCLHVPSLLLLQDPPRPPHGGYVRPCVPFRPPPAMLPVAGGLPSHRSPSCQALLHAVGLSRTRAGKAGGAHAEPPSLLPAQHGAGRSAGGSSCPSRDQHRGFAPLPPGLQLMPPSYPCGAAPWGSGCPRLCSHRPRAPTRGKEELEGGFQSPGSAASCSHPFSAHPDPPSPACPPGGCPAEGSSSPPRPAWLLSPRTGGPAGPPRQQPRRRDVGDGGPCMGRTF